MHAPTLKRTSIWLIVALTGLAFALRLYRLGWPELRGDEAFGLLFSGQSLPDMLRQTLQLLEPHPPLDYLLLHVWTALAGNSEWALRFTSLVFGVAAVPLVYRLSVLLDGRSLGIWAAALVAVNPFQLGHAQEARMYAVSTALGLGAAICLILALRDNRPRDWGGYVVLSIANAYTHYYALFLIGAFALYWLIAGPRSRRRPWLMAHAAIGLLFVPWLVAGWRVLTAYRGNGDSPGFIEMLGRSLQAFSVGQTLTPDVAPFLLPFFALAAVVGLAALVRRRPSSALFLGLYLALPVLAVYLSSLSRPVFNERYLAAMAPPFYVLVAAGIAGWGRGFRAPRRTAQYALAILLLAASLYSVYGYFFDAQFTRNRGWRELASELSRNAANGDVIVQNYPDPTLWYYYRGAVPHAVAPDTRPADWESTAAGLKRLGEQYGRLWFVPYKSTDWDADGQVGLWLDRHWERVSEESAGGFALRQYRPVRLALAEGRPADIAWRDLIALRGFRIEPSAGDRTIVRPGDALEVTFYWEALRPIPIDYTVFVHLQSTGARIVAQRDSRPVHGTFPTTQWQPGAQIVDPYVIIVPSDSVAGIYSIAVGFYQSPTGDRLKVGTGRPEELPDRYVLPQDIVVE